MTGAIPRVGAVAIAALVAGCPTPPDPPAPDPIVDPLSRPAEPTLSVGSFATASECGECHPEHLAQWAGSTHAYAIHDPVFRALVEVRQADFGGAQDSFCMQCHTAIGVRGGEVVPGFSWNDLSPVVQEGVTCEACHRVSRLERPYNSGHVIDEDGPVRGPIADPEANPTHASRYSELHTTSAFCAGCHDVVELDGLPLERPYEEWLESPAAEDGRPCQDCHMAAYSGIAAEGLETERTLHDHRFVGVDLPLSEDFAPPEVEEDLAVRVAALLDGIATLELAAEPVAPGETVNLLVTVGNEIDGHNLPTGSTFLRQLWLEVTVTDAEGAVLYRTGHLDENDDLRDHWSEVDPYGDPDLVVLGARLTAADGAPELFPWRANELTSTALPPRHRRTWTLFVPTAAGTAGPLQIAARLRFRTHPPYLLRALGLDDLLARVRTWELAEAELALPLAPTP